MTDFVLQGPASVSVAKKWKWKGFGAALHNNKKPTVDEASFHMLSLSRTNLGVRLSTIEESSLASEGQKKIFSTVTEMLKAPAKASMTTRNLEWDEIYKAESLIVLLLSRGQLRQEIRSRLQELAKANPAEAELMRRDYEELLKQPAEGQNGPDDATLRGFLLRVMEAVHWCAKKEYLARPLRQEATTRILKCLLISFFLLVVPYVVLIWDFGAHDANVHTIWSLFALYTALTAGLLGSFCSRLNSIQGQWANMNLEEVFLQREWPYTLLRAGVGVCGALIVYFFLRSGIAEGALFPKFDEIRIEMVDVISNGVVPAIKMSFVMPSKSLALLTFWCFLAGFSETLVSSILKGTERQVTQATASGRGGRPA